MRAGRYVVVGSGGVGCALGGLLAASGRRVTFVARGPQLEALQREPLVIARPAGALHLRVDVVPNVGAARIDGDDVVFLTTKTADVPAVVAELARVASPDTSIVCAQNGIAAERMASAANPKPMSMVVFAPVVFLVPGRVALHGSPTPGMLELGEHPEGTSERVEAITRDLIDAGFDARAEPRIRRRKLGKLLLNLGNAVQALAGRGASDPALLRRLQAEGRACFLAAGLDFADVGESETRYAAVTEAPVAGASREGGSTWQSLARHKQPETRFLNGEIVAMGEALGIPTPANRAVVELVERAFAHGRAPGFIPAGEISRHIEGPVGAES